MDCQFVTRPDTAGRIATTGVTAILLVAGFLTPGPMHAAGLNGTLSLSSAGTDTIAVNGTDIDFDYTGGVTSTFPPTATNCPGATCTVDGNGDNGQFTITSASTSSFAPIIGTNVTVHDLNATSEPTGNMLSPGLNDFITFGAQGSWDITLTEIMAGVEGTAGCTATGVNCTPAGSPFNLTNEGAGQVAVSFAFMGTATDGLGDTSNVGGTFSTTFSGTSIEQILTDLNNGQSVVSSANATIDVTTISPVPEPASAWLLLLGSGLLAASAFYRRRQQRP